MTNTVIQNLEKMLAAGKESALLRFSLGNEYLKQAQGPMAVTHLQRAVELDAHYSAAWKLLGKALLVAERKEEALAAYREGIVVANNRGDEQAAKEMTVFARRIEKELGGSA